MPALVCTGEDGPGLVRSTSSAPLFPRFSPGVMRALRTDSTVSADALLLPWRPEVPGVLAVLAAVLARNEGGDAVESRGAERHVSKWVLISWK